MDEGHPVLMNHRRTTAIEDGSPEMEKGQAMNKQTNETASNGL